MQPRVTAIVVSPDGPERLERTLEAVNAGTRIPDRIIQVQDWSALTNLPVHAEDDEEWLWLLTPDLEPLPDALDRLLAAVEVAPSVAVAGPKLVDPDDPSLILSFGDSISDYGATIPLVEDELDQAQHDRSPDVLGVAREGMLVRRRIVEGLGGFDPGLPLVDGGLDFSVRARLAGSRVVRVADARIRRHRRPEDVGRSRPAPARVRTRIARRAQLHRRLVWAPALAVPLHWLSLLPLALIRSVGRLLGKRPELIGGELAAAFAAAFDRHVAGARRRLKRAKKSGWTTIAPLRIPPQEVRHRRAEARERWAELRGVELELRRARFVPGGAVVALIALGLSAILNWRILGSGVLTGGGLRPLAGNAGDLWSGVLGRAADGPLDWHPADPFSALVAVLGSVTVWAPSLAMVILWIIAMPLAALGAWWCATRISERGFPPVVAALAWMIAPSFLAALVDGRPGAVIAHVVLPWFLLALLEAARSWSAAAGAALLFAVTVASAPTLAAALTVVVVLAAALRPRRIVRQLGIPLLGLALLAPVAIVQFSRGVPLAALLDPGAPHPFASPSNGELLLGIPASGLADWSLLLGDGEGGGLSILTDSLLLPAVLVAPLAVLALLGAFLPGSRRAIPALVVAFLGLATAVGADHLILGAVGEVPLSPWPGAGLSLYWLGLVAAAVSALEALRRAAVAAGAVLLVGLLTAIVPAGLAALTDETPTVRSATRVLPAIVAAESAGDPTLGTLVLTAQQDGSIAVRIERGGGTTLESLSTLDLTVQSGSVDADAERLAELAGNLASFGAADVVPVLQDFGIAFVLAPDVDGRSAQLTAQRVIEALDASPQLDPVGETEVGTLWRVDAERVEAAPDGPRGELATGILLLQGGLLLVALLLALPTGPRRRVVDPAPLPGEDPADTFDEDDNA